MNRKTILFALALGGGGSAWFVPWKTNDASAQRVGVHELYNVHRADMRITIVENGTMVAKESQPKLVAGPAPSGSVPGVVPVQLSST